ncbi:MAG: MFS transporter [Chloroflexota bacterium]
MIDANRKRPKIFYGWYVVGACVLIILFTSGTVHFGFTALFEPIVKEFGWDYAQISLAGSLRGLETGLLSPVVGLLVDRWGPRRLFFAGTIVVCLGFLLLSRVSSLVMFYGAFALIALGYSAFSDAVTMTSVANWFRRKADTATGIVASGFGLGGLLVPVVTKLVDVLNWRATMLTVGLSFPVVVLPLSLLVRHKPEDYGYEPDGVVSRPVEPGNIEVLTQSKEVSIPAKQAIRTRVFWHVAIGSMCHVFVAGAVVMHVMPYLSSLGVSRTVSSLVALVLPIASVCGRLSSGWFSDRMGKKRVFTASFVLMTAGLLLYTYITPQTIWLLVPFLMTYGLGWGGNVTMRIALIREYFGRQSFGTILGFTAGIMMAGSIVGAPLAGWVFDTWGRYQFAWLGCSAITCLGMVLGLTIPPISRKVGFSIQPHTLQGTR